MPLLPLLSYVFAGWCGGLEVAYAVIRFSEGDTTAGAWFALSAVVTASLMIVFGSRDMRRGRITRR